MKTDNQIIAEFIGMTSSFDTYFDPKQNCHFEIKDFKYSTSWDWLMPVVEKIKNIPASEHPDFTSVNWRRQVIDMPISSELQSVYNKVVKFVKHYNSHKQ